MPKILYLITDYKASLSRGKSFFGDFLLGKSHIISLLMSSANTGIKIIIGIREKFYKKNETFLKISIKFSDNAKEWIPQISWY